MAGMVKRPMEDTEPYVQRPSMGHTGKLVWGSQGPGWRGALCYTPAERPMEMSKFTLAVKILVFAAVAYFWFMWSASPDPEMNTLVRFLGLFAGLFLLAKFIFFSGHKKKV